jgi:hypothetical protein
MIEVNGSMHDIRRRFVRGLLEGLEPEELHAFVTNGRQDAREEAA